MNQRNKYIYVVLVKALTGLGKFARFFSKYEYTHIAVSLDESLDDFITFSRKKHFEPFNSGFMHETLDCYAFGDNKSIKLKVFKVPVSTDSYKEIKKYISSIEEENEYIFNLLSMATMGVFHGVNIYKALNCMSFVSKVISLTNTVKMDKKYYKYNIKEIDNLLSDYFYKEELFNKTKIINKNYMDKVSIFKNIKGFLTINGKLIYRLIFKRNDNYEK